MKKFFSAILVGVLLLPTVNSNPYYSSEQAKSLLAILAHPDDELLMGATLAHYASKGVDVYAVICTDGALGTTSFSSIPAGPQLAAARKEEMICSAKALGIHAPIFLQLPDGLGTRDGSIQLQLDVLKRAVDSLFNAMRPDAVITFGAEGWTGHPDHRLVGDVVTEVFTSKKFSDHANLFYPALPTGSITDKSWAKFLTVDLVYLNVRVKLDAEDYSKLRNAFECHRTQYRESVRKRLPLFHEETQRRVAMFRSFKKGSEASKSLFAE